MRFTDRYEAGTLLAEELRVYRDQPSIIYALPRGGVVIGAVIAKAIKAPLELIIPRKIGHPNNPEFGIGAVTETGEPVLNKEVTAGLDNEWLENEIERERTESRRRRIEYTSGRSPLSPKDKTAILVDDGIATGLTIKAALIELNYKSPAKIVVAVPVIPQDIALELARLGAEVIALTIPRVYLGAVGAYYVSFEQVTDEEVKAWIKEAL